MTEPTYQKVPEPQFDEAQKPVAFEYVSVDKQAETATAVPLEATVVTQDTTGHFILACIGTYCCGVFGVLGTLMCCPSNHGKGGAATGCAVLFFKLLIVSIVALAVVNNQHGPSSFVASGVDRTKCEQFGGKWVDDDEETYFHFNSREGDALSRRQGKHREGGRRHRGGLRGHRGEEGVRRFGRRSGGMRHHTNFSDPEVVAYINQKLTSYVSTHPEDLAVVEMLGLPVESRRAFMKSQGRSFCRHVHKIVDFAAFRQQRHAEQGTAVPAIEPHLFTDENMPRPDDDMHCRCPAYYITVFDESGNVNCRRSVAYWWGSLISTFLLCTSFLLLRAYYLHRAASSVTVTVQPVYAAEGIVVQA
ncbi:hypothetical protein DIPPA_05199 [Diplonema papillatum]|nr:hypothetical protein DIPPA_05199 [Diplonema papillatum]